MQETSSVSQELYLGAQPDIGGKGDEGAEQRRRRWQLKEKSLTRRLKHVWLARKPRLTPSVELPEIKTISFYAWNTSHQSQYFWTRFWARLG